MTGPFGTGPLTVVRRSGVVSGEEDLRRVVAMAGRKDGPGDAVLLLSRCAPTAAFSRRDLLLPGYERAAASARSHGFHPVVRPVGGRLAAYDEGSLVLHLWAAHEQPRAHLRERFQLIGEALVEAVGTLGVEDARVGTVAGEYCDGAWSVNVAGRAKVAGTGQRLYRRGFLFCAIVTVTDRGPLIPMLVDAYRELGLPLDPATIGSVDRWAPGVRLDDAREAVTAAVSRLIPRPR